MQIMRSRLYDKMSPNRFRTQECCNNVSEYLFQSRVNVDDSIYPYAIHLSMNESPGLEPEMLDIHYTGRRFDKTSIPLNMLGDLSTLNDLVLDLASEIYRKTNKTSRVPRHFRDNHVLNLRSITEGSTIVGVSPNQCQVQMMLSNYWPDCADVSTDENECVNVALEELIDFFKAGESEYEDVIIPRLKSLGSRLRDDESMGFNFRGCKAEYNQKTRQKLMGEKTEYTTYETLYGKVTEVDTIRKSFKLSLASNPDKRYDFQLKNLRDENQPLELGTLLQRNMAITGEFNVKKGSLDNISIDDYQILEERDVDCRLRELSSLEGGWGETGREASLNKEMIQKLIDLYDEFGSEMRHPLIFPTPDGNLQFEWDSDDLLELDLNLSNLKGTLYVFDREHIIDLNLEEGWGTLLKVVGNHA